MGDKIPQGYFKEIFENTGIISKSNHSDKQAANNADDETSVNLHKPGFAVEVEVSARQIMQEYPEYGTQEKGNKIISDGPVTFERVDFGKSVV
jgi:hypothetical protein